jgi:hypothetical protein
MRWAMENRGLDHLLTQITWVYLSDGALRGYMILGKSFLLPNISFQPHKITEVL